MAHNTYLIAKRKYRLHLTIAKKQAYERFIDTSPNKCRAAWEVINKERNRVELSEVTLDPEVINRYFLDSVKEISSKIPSSNMTISDLLNNYQTPPHVFHWQDITPDEVVRVVKQFSNSKSLDVFHLSNKVVKSTISYVQVPLAFILSKCLEVGYFADSLKVSKVIPIYKKGDKHLPQNYRPVSIVPIFSKLFEALMHKQLSYYFEHFNLLSDSQFGFRAGRSTINAVMEVVDHTLQAFDKRESVALSLLDLSKAFDCVPFISIMQKLRFYGISDNACKVISSYLENRRQFVSINGSNSAVQNVTIGVPQGSVLNSFFLQL